MEITNVGLRSITVTKERKLTVGSKVHMLASYGYCGIEEAKAEIVEMVIKGGVPYSNHRSLIEASDEHMIAFDTDDVNEVPWVVYKYTEGSEVGEVIAMPLEIFVDHSHPVF